MGCLYGGVKKTPPFIFKEDMAETISNVINDLHFCNVGPRCNNCSRKTNKGSCDIELVRDAIEYLQVLRNIQEAAEPNDLNWVISLIKKSK